MEGAWSCYRDGHFNGRRMVMLQRWCLMEGAWSCYGGCQFNGGRMVITEVPSNRGSMFMLQWWAI